MRHPTVTICTVGFRFHACDIHVGHGVTRLAVGVDHRLRGVAGDNALGHVAKRVDEHVARAFHGLERELGQQRRRRVALVAGQVGVRGQLVRHRFGSHDMTA